MVTHVLVNYFFACQLIGHNSLSSICTNSFCVSMLHEFDTLNPSVGALSVIALEVKLIMAGSELPLELDEGQ